MYQLPPSTFQTSRNSQDEMNAQGVDISTLMVIYWCLLRIAWRGYVPVEISLVQAQKAVALYTTGRVSPDDLPPILKLADMRLSHMRAGPRLGFPFYSDMGKQPFSLLCGTQARPTME